MPPPRTVKLTLAYDGTRFVGWQRQAEGESIQGLLETALARFEGVPVTVHGAGRTDAGVHALGQVASVQLAGGHDTAALLRGLNASLPPDVRVLRVDEVTAEFHARFSARSKTYRYVLCTSPIASPFDRLYAWHAGAGLDLAAMREASAALVGTHDFAAFRSTGTESSGTVRTVTRSELPPSRAQRASASLAEAFGGGGTPQETLAYEIEGNGFLRHMVRAIVGTLVEVGRGLRPVASVAALLQGGTRAQAGATAPPHGLFLVRVEYD